MYICSRVKVGVYNVKRTVMTIKRKYTAYETRLLIAAPFMPRMGIRLLFNRIEETVSSTEKINEKA